MAKSRGYHQPMRALMDKKPTQGDSLGDLTLTVAIYCPAWAKCRRLASSLLLWKLKCGGPISPSRGIWGTCACVWKFRIDPPKWQFQLDTLYRPLRASWFRGTVYYFQTNTYDQIAHQMVYDNFQATNLKVPNLREDHVRLCARETHPDISTWHMT